MRGLDGDGDWLGVPLNSQLGQLSVGLGIVSKEGILVGCVLLSIWPARTNTSAKTRSSSCSNWYHMSSRL